MRLASTVIIGVAAIALISLGTVWSMTAPAHGPLASTLRPRPGRSTVATTSREALAHTVLTMTERLAVAPTDSDAAVRLSDALLRQARVLNHAGLAFRAEAALDTVLDAAPSDYRARRMRALVYLSQHRFREARLEAERCRALHAGGPADDASWIDGVIGDASLELGDYPEAFAAFDRMMERRPDAAAYARVSYARELQGDLDGAIALMTMAAEATSAHDPESQAWHAAQLGHLYLISDRTTEARREYGRADVLFPDYPLAAIGLAKVDIANGELSAALARVMKIVDAAPSATGFALAGDVLSQLGRDSEADRYYRLAEAAWASDTPEPAHLARLLATRGRHLDEAVRLAEDAFAQRQDIYTADALAWAYFKAGRLSDAAHSMESAMRTGSRDPQLLAHLAVITDAATGRPQGLQ